MADLSFSVEDDIVTSEDTNTNLGWELSTNDTSVTSESVGYYPDVVNIIEAISVMVFFNFGVVGSDRVVLTDTVSLDPIPNAQSNDSVGVQDILSQYPDTVFVMEDITIIILSPGEVFQIENTPVSEFVNVVVTSSFSSVNPKKIIAEATDPLTIRIETKAF